MKLVKIIRIIAVALWALAGCDSDVPVSTAGLEFFEQESTVNCTDEGVNE